MEIGLLRLSTDDLLIAKYEFVDELIILDNPVKIRVNQEKGEFILSHWNQFSKSSTVTMGLHWFMYLTIPTDEMAKHYEKFINTKEEVELTSPTQILH